MDLSDDDQARSMDRLSRLPDEVLTQIFTSVGCVSKNDLCAVSRLNKHYHVIVDSILYKSLHFDLPEHHLTFSQSLHRRPRRGSLVIGMRLEYPSRPLGHLQLDLPVPGSHFDASQPGFQDTLSRTLSAMSNLEMLDVAVPSTLLGGIGTLFNGPFDLTCLRSCTLFYQTADDAYWDLRQNIHIFAHPTLEELTVRRARLDSKAVDFLQKPHQTCLQRLHLIECDISDDALGDLLEFPAALREFAMVQLAEPRPALKESSRDIGHYVIALGAAAASLESVTIDCPSLTGKRALRLREFAAIKTLRLNHDYQLFGKPGKHRPRMHSVGLPPELETLEFLSPMNSDEEVLDLLVHAVQMKDVTARKLMRIICVEGDDGDVPAEFIHACRKQGLQLDIIGQLEDAVEASDRNQGEDEDCRTSCETSRGTASPTSPEDSAN